MKICPHCGGMLLRDAIDGTLTCHSDTCPLNAPALKSWERAETLGIAARALGWVLLVAAKIALAVWFVRWAVAL